MTSSCYNRFGLLLLAALWFCQAGAWAQPVASEPDRKPAPADAKGPAAPAKAGEEAAPPEEALAAPVERSGDIVTLKSGKILSGGQIVRSTPKAYLVQFGDTGEPLEIPRRMVAGIQYDEVDPLKARREAVLDESRQAEGEMLAGERLSPELSEKLNTVISKEPIQYDRRDFVTILEELSSSLGVKIDMHESVKQMEGKKRLWTAEIPANTTLMSLVQVNLLTGFDDLTVRYLADGILVITKAAVAAQEPAPPAQPAQ